MGAATITIGDSIATIITMGMIIIPIIVIYKVFKNIEKRAQEKREIEKQNTLILQKSMEDLNNRLHEIEKMIKKLNDKTTSE